MRYLAIALIFSFGLQAQKIEFRDISFKEGLQAAADEGKPVFIDCFTTWCGPCKWMSANIFTDASVAEYYNENYICLKIDMEKGEGLDIAKNYKIRAYPTLLYLDDQGERLLVKVGASREPQGYVDAGEQAKDPQRNLPYLVANVEDNFEDPEFMLDYFNTASMANMVGEGMVDRYFEQFEVEQWTEEMNWNIIRSAADDINTATFKKLVANIEIIAASRPDDGQAYIEQTLYYGLANMLYRARTEEAQARFEALKGEYLTEEFAGAGKMNFRLGLIAAQKNEDYEAYADLAMGNVKQYIWDDANELNSVSWSVYEKVKNKAAQRAALEWAARAVELDPQHQILDTYAHLLEVNLQKEKALEVEIQALEKAQAEGANTKSYQEYIDQLKG